MIQRSRKVSAGMFADRPWMNLCHILRSTHLQNQHVRTVAGDSMRRFTSFICVVVASLHHVARISAIDVGPMYSTHHVNTLADQRRGPSDVALHLQAG